MIYDLQDIPADTSSVRPRTGQASPDVRISVAIQAEWQRIFHALAVPEYMDAWLTMSGIDRLECRPEQGHADSFRIDFSTAGAPSKTVFGTCIRTRPDEISYLWEKALSDSTARSLVKMRLRRGPRRCSLHLIHQGLWGQKECEWYSVMWQRSLEKLRALMEHRPSRVAIETNRAYPSKSTLSISAARSLLTPVSMPSAQRIARTVLPKLEARSPKPPCVEEVLFPA
jgi:uncharacterized protein YndB with AHSA1/START domain